MQEEKRDIYPIVSGVEYSEAKLEKEIRACGLPAVSEDGEAMIGAIQPYLAWAQGQRGNDYYPRRLISCDGVIAIRRTVATCPKCDATVYAHFESWEKEDDGTWSAQHASLDCETEPDIDSPEFNEWMRWHYDMPYVYWMPLKVRLAKWINERYYFDCD